jgi:hypothetical protein
MIRGYPWRMWIRKRFPFLRSRSKFKNGDKVGLYDECWVVIDRRIDHCGQILLEKDEKMLWVDPYKLYLWEDPS